MAGNHVQIISVLVLEQTISAQNSLASAAKTSSSFISMIHKSAKKCSAKHDYAMIQDSWLVHFASLKKTSIMVQKVKIILTPSTNIVYITG